MENNEFIANTGKFGNKVIEFEGIRFKSILEKRAYQLYKEAGFTPQYESVVYTIIDKHILSDELVFYKPFKKILNKSRKTLLPITYTPDFIFIYNNHQIIVDTKGMKNETYPIKIKLFLCHLDKIKTMPILFFEPHTIRQIKESINLIKLLPNSD